MKLRKRTELTLGRNQSFDLGWLFFRGEGRKFEQPEVDVSQWRTLDLPHDWSIEDAPGESSPERLGPFDSSAVGGSDTGYTLGGEGWYRKEFYATDLPPDAVVEIHFDGIAVESDVWINGRHLGHRVNAYMAFQYQLSAHLKRDGKNVVVVRARNSGQNSRWYAGSGIYRSVTLNVIGQTARIAPWGVYATTRRIDAQQADIDVTTHLESVSEAMILITRLRDADGSVVAEASSPAAATIEQTLSLQKPELWSPAAPNLYQLESVLQQGETVIDQLQQDYGIRLVSFDPAHGMRINGEVTKLRGGCMHHDNGLLGAAAFADAEERKVKLLKSRGFNAVRSSHNPSSHAFRRACDRLGMLLIEESFDMWHAGKLPDDYSIHFKEHWQADLNSMVLNARNSPSVIMWSIGNEVPDRSTPEGVKWSWHLANEVHRLDPTRPVTAGLNGSPGRRLLAAEGTAREGQAGKADYASSIFLDVVGYNYKLSDFRKDHPVKPDRVFYGSETYARQAYDYTALAESESYMIGEFVWTAMDYLGEAGLGLTRRMPAENAVMLPHTFPVVGAFCGDIDLLGMQKPQSLARDVMWGLSSLEIAIARPLDEGQVELIPLWGWPEELPSWTWPGAEGRTVTLRAYTQADQISVFVNGTQIAERKLTAADNKRTDVEIVYTPGELEVIAFRGGVKIGHRRLVTASAPQQLKLTAEQASGRGDRQALHYVHIAVTDEAGRLSPDAMENIRLKVDGPAEVIGFGSANPRAVGSYQALRAQTYQGRALAILRATGNAGVVKIRAEAEGRVAAETTLVLN